MTFRWVQGSHTLGAVNSSGIARQALAGVFEGETLFRTLISFYVREIFAIISSTQAHHRNIPAMMGVTQFPLGETPPADTGPKSTPDRDWILWSQSYPLVQLYAWDSTGSPTSGFASWGSPRGMENTEARRLAPDGGHQWWAFIEGVGLEALEVSANVTCYVSYRQLIQEAP